MFLMACLALRWRPHQLLGAVQSVCQIVAGRGGCERRRWRRATGKPGSDLSRRPSGLSQRSCVGMAQHVWVQPVKARYGADVLDDLVGVRVRQRPADRGPGQVDEHVIAVQVGDLTEEVSGVQVEEPAGRGHRELRSLL